MPERITTIEDLTHKIFENNRKIVGVYVDEIKGLQSVPQLNGLLDLLVKGISELNSNGEERRNGTREKIKEIRAILDQLDKDISENIKAIPIREILNKLETTISDIK